VPATVQADHLVRVLAMVFYGISIASQSKERILRVRVG